jgi:hypothetical protein
MALSKTGCKRRLFLLIVAALKREGIKWGGKEAMEGSR